MWLFLGIAAGVFVLSIIVMQFCTSGGIRNVPPFHVALTQELFANKDKDYTSPIHIHSSGICFINPLKHQFMYMNLYGRYYRDIDLREVQLDWKPQAFMTKDGATFVIDTIGFMRIVNVGLAARSCRNLGSTIQELVMSEIRKIVLELDSRQVVHERDAIEFRATKAVMPIEDSKDSPTKLTVNLPVTYGVNLRIRVQSVTPSDKFAATLSENQQEIQKLQMTADLNARKHADFLQQSARDHERNERIHALQKAEALAKISITETQRMSELQIESNKKRTENDEKNRVLAEENRVRLQAKTEEAELEIKNMTRKRKLIEESWEREMAFAKELKATGASDIVIGMCLRPQMEMKMILPPMVAGSSPVLMSGK